MNPISQERREANPTPRATVHIEPKDAGAEDDPLIAALRILAAGRRAQAQVLPAWKAANKEDK